MKRADISLFRGKPKPEPADFPPEMTETPAHTLSQEEVDCIQPTTPSLAKIRHSLPFRYKNRARASGQVGDGYDCRGSCKPRGVECMEPIPPAQSQARYKKQGENKTRRKQDKTKTRQDENKTRRASPVTSESHERMHPGMMADVRIERYRL